MSEHPIVAQAAAGAPRFVETEPARILELLVAEIETLTGRTLQPSQVEMYLLEVIAYIVSVARAEDQLALEQNLLATARSDRLDAIGADRSTPRLQATHASAEVRFSADAPLPTARTIPAGTRVGIGAATFATTKTGAIPQDAVSVVLPVVAVEPGPAQTPVDAGPGTPVAMVDAIPQVAAAELMRAITAGVAREEDEAYRLRVALAWERISRGGARSSYVAATLGWSARVLAVHAERPQAGYARIVPLLAGGAALTPADRESLLAWLADGRTPQGDFVELEDPAPEAFDVRLSLVLDYFEAADAAIQAVATVLDGWRRTLGGRIVPSDLIAAARAVPGVIEADLPGLAYHVVPPDAFRDGAMLAPIVVVA